MAAYIGLHEQIRRNNVRSTLILAGFPLLILTAVYAFFFFVLGKERIDEVNIRFLHTIPFIAGGVIVWFLIAYFANAAMIKMATQSRTLERSEGMRVYNLTENLCMSIGMTMPKLYIIDSPALNAFASGIDQKSFAVTLTSGIIEKLDDAELEGVIAHELTHIRNRDVRLLIISIIFVGILSFAVQLLFRSVMYGGISRGRKDEKEDNKMVLIALVIAAVAYLLSILFKFALSRKREYLADAGAVEMTRNTKAMASALRKISGNDEVDAIKSDDVKQMFIENKSLSGLSGLFATHPPIEKRIAVLEQM